MPVMDGFQFREEQRQDPALAKIPVVVMSAHVQFEDKARHEAPVFLRKPIDMDTILKVAETHCAKSA
jgi:CheY-like chemotaxis protein